MLGATSVDRLRCQRTAAVRAGSGCSAGEISIALFDLRRDLLQNRDESLSVARTDHLIEVALMPSRAARQRRKRFFSGRRQAEAVGAPVAVHPLSLDKAPPHQILDHRGEAGLIAAVGKG